MLYVVYLVTFILYLIQGISWDRITNFVDAITVTFLVVPCLLILFCTRSFPAFGRAFLSAFGKKAESAVRCRESLQAVRMVMSTVMLFGGICFLIGMVNSIRSQDFSSVDSIGWICLDLSVAVLPLFYAMLVCAVLLPVFFMLKRQLTGEGSKDLQDQ